VQTRQLVLAIWLAGSCLWAADSVSVVAKVGGGVCSTAASPRIPEIGKIVAAFSPPQAMPVFQGNACSQCTRSATLRPTNVRTGQ
jgi:hypothetical protein